jgi:hypothetical protein
MAASFNMANGYEASYSISQTGNATVSVRSSTPMKARAVYVGAASLEFLWVSSGKSSHWQFTPTLLDQTLAQTEVISETEKTQVVNVELGNRMFPATGLIKTNAVGEIRAPAVHFDLPYAYDLWVFLLRSPWSPLKINIEKSPLTITHSSAQVMAQIETSNFDERKSLRVDVTVNGEGFKRIWLSLKRNVKRASLEETLGEVVDGMETFTWKPITTNFDTVLVTSSNMSLGAFLDFLKSLGADAKQSLLGAYMPSDFLLCDGSGIDYTLRLRGEKQIFGHEEDKTKITLNY